MKHFLKFAKYAALACIFLNAALLVDGACNNCPLQGPPGPNGSPGIPGTTPSCIGCSSVSCIQSCEVDPATCTQSCEVDPATCTQSCSGITCTQPCDVDPSTCTQSCAGIPCTQSCEVDPATCTQSCAGITCAQPCVASSSLSYGTWFLRAAPAIDIFPDDIVPFGVGEPAGPGAPLLITNVVGAFTLTNAGVYYVAYGVCTAQGGQPFQLMLNGLPIVGGKMKAGLDRVIKPIVLTFVAPAGAVITLVLEGTLFATLGNTGDPEDVNVPAAYISFLQIQ